MKTLELKPPEYVVPKNEGESVKVSRNGKTEEFKLQIESQAEFLAFFRELYRFWKMRSILDNALARYETGDINFTNAAENLNHLTLEMRKIDSAMMGVARKFWQFTDAKEDKTKAARIEQLFEPHGQAFARMIADCCEVALVSEDDQKN